MKANDLSVAVGQQKTSRRVVFPPARPTKEEATLEVRTAMWKEEVNTYVTVNCKNDGVQNTQQLSQAQERGKLKHLRIIFITHSLID